ncbi:nucleotidyltransferase domain-containing protein [Streptomyces rubiginosohelvolus]|uniref:nucleotidyltransferase domain-containing protein n=1 Tax=Streptomyces rubiginosohelvolus TaxID=67362 RepID=UPI0033C392F6
MSERRPPGGETGRPLPADEHLPDGGTELSPSEIEALGSRWASAWTPDEVARRLAGVGAPWCVAAGWALDLFRGRQTRAHGDIEIAVPAGRFPEVRRRFPGYAFDAAGSGRIWEDAAPDVLAAVHQTWVRDPATGDYLLDVFREPHDGDTWICRRDESIRRPYDEIVHHTRDGIPYLAPELVLLFKAKHARPKDQADFDATVPYLSPEQRASLAGLLDRVHPGHPWSAGL